MTIITNSMPSVLMEAVTSLRPKIQNLAVALGETPSISDAAISDYHVNVRVLTRDFVQAIIRVTAHRNSDGTATINSNVLFERLDENYVQQGSLPENKEKEAITWTLDSAAALYELNQEMNHWGARTNVAWVVTVKKNSNEKIAAHKGRDNDNVSIVCDQMPL